VLGGDDITGLNLEVVVERPAPRVLGERLPLCGAKLVRRRILSRDNLDENGASIWVRRGSRAEG
jgi:hypothetical protein